MMTEMRYLVFLLCLVGASAPGQGAMAKDGTDELAKAAFQAGTQAYTDGDFKAAATAFRRAYYARPSWKLMYNIGQAEAASRRQGLAIEAFEKYLAEGGDEVPEDRRETVYKEIDRLRRIVGSISLKAPEGLDVKVDGVSRGKTPLAGRIRVSASVEHIITLHDGKEVVDEQTVVVAGQESIEVEMTRNGDVAQNPEMPATAEGDREEQNANMAALYARQKRKTKRLAITSYVLGGVGVLSFLGGTVTGIKALQLDKDFPSDTYCVDGECQSDAEEKLGERDDMVAATNSLLGLGAVCVGAGVVFFILSKKQGREAEALKAKMSLLPAFSHDGGGFVLEGRF